MNRREFGHTALGRFSIAEVSFYPLESGGQIANFIVLGLMIVIN